MERAAAEGGVEEAVFEGKSLHPGAGEMHVGNDAFLRRVGRALTQHARRDVDAEHFPQRRGDAPAEGAGAAGDVEHAAFARTEICRDRRDQLGQRAAVKTAEKIEHDRIPQARLVDARQPVDEAHSPQRGVRAAGELFANEIGDAVRDRVCLEANGTAQRALFPLQELLARGAGIASQFAGHGRASILRTRRENLMYGGFARGAADAASGFAEIGGGDLGAAQEVGAAAFERDRAALEDVGVVGDGERLARVLLDEQDRGAAGALGGDDREDLLDELGGDTLAGGVG